MVNWLLRIFSQKTVSVFFRKELLQPFVNAEEHLLFELYGVIVDINHHAGFKLFSEDTSCVKQQPKHYV